MTTNQTFTAADVAALADLVRPFMPEGMTVEAATAAAVYGARADAEQRFHRFFYGDHTYRRAIVGALSGTYDEFRAEAAA